MKAGIYSRPKRGAFLVVAIVAALAAGLLVSPATAGGNHAAAQSDACVSNPLYSSIWSLTSGSSMLRGGGATARKEKDRSNVVAETEVPKGSTAAFLGQATIPVYFHVVAAGKSPNKGWVSDSQITQQIAVLDDTFSGRRGGADTGFRFTLAGVTRTVNAEWYAQETFQAEIDMKTALKQGDATALNIYSTSGGGFLGWAYLPKIVINDTFNVLDGVIVHYASLPGGSFAPFNLGFTATHEAGHWLGLYHTFDYGCGGHGDYVTDTPDMSIPTSGCPEGKDSCPQAGLDPIHNYMDYSDDACYTEFTGGQAERMQDQYSHWRSQVGY